MTEVHLNRIDTDTLLDRKRTLLMQLVKKLTALGLPIEYPYTVMRAAQDAKLSGASYVELLELLLEIESIKYTLCSRMVPHVGENEAGI